LRQKAIYNIAEGQFTELKSKMLNWVNQFSIFVFLDSNGYTDKYGAYECLLGADNISQFDLFDNAPINDWAFGHICYDYKNELEPKLTSRHPAHIGFTPYSFFIPRIVCYIDRGKTTLQVEACGTDPQKVIEDILSTTSPEHNPTLPQLHFHQRIDRSTYIHTVQALREHIRNGDCYEINFCNEGFTEVKNLNCLQVFKALNELSPAPYAAYYRHNDKYLICASPERYLRKTGQKLISQPIKGTIRRSADPAEDARLRDELYYSEKDRAENVMIVDLVRNDLARTCKLGTIQVEELFGLHQYPHVHQMVSTVCGQLQEGIPTADSIRYSFPMGSMTGAPKIKVMELIDRYEASRRELFSGTVGYITPTGDFDLNVVIRSLYYNAQNAYLSYQTGGAITYDSIPEAEWEEMRLKAWAVERIFS
jgi:para-aminobenzoate synthetase component 1